MEKLLTTIWDNIYPLLNVKYIIILILSANILINKANLHIKVSKWFGENGNKVYAVLALALILSIPWGIVFLIQHRPLEEHFKLAVSYCVATSIYEVFIKKFLNNGTKTQ